MSGYTKENQCRNFAPNIFNKNKCQNCFKPRETHLLLDKDLNKATPIYVGWLLFAPIGTDFSNPTHRTRKWQRRYFILFEHGALRYALDDNANTLPQGTINMNQCTDVVHAETETGQKYSLCIYHPEMKYFIRTESRDDTTGWYEKLVVFPQTIKQEAINRRRFPRRYGSAKAPSTTSSELNKTPSAVTYDALRSPKSETPPRDNIIPTPSESQVERKPSDLKRGRSISRKSTDKKQGTQTPDVQRPVRRAKSLDRHSHDLNDFTVDGTSQRRGWIMKRRNAAKETWTKHWFVMSEDALKYYKDPSSEEFSEADGKIKLDDIVRVGKVDLNENYGFSIYTVNEEITLAAVTSRIRQGWINTIENSSKLVNEKENSEKIVPEKAPEVFDERMVEKSMERRAKKRLRRKMGRSRTYDFAELRSAARRTVDMNPDEKTDSTTKELKDELDTLLMAEIAKSKQENVRQNGLDSPDGSKKAQVSPRTPKQASTANENSKYKPPLTQKMVNGDQWDKIEKSGLLAAVLPGADAAVEKSSIVAACNSLKSEVEFMAKQIELGKKVMGDVLSEQKEKIDSEKADSLKSGAAICADDSNSDKFRALEIAHKCAMEENKRLRDEIVQCRTTRDQDMNRMSGKIKDLKTLLAMADQRSRIKAGHKTDKNDRTLKDKVSELEAEMVDTGQMIDRRLSALETPRRKETDDSDEAGSTSSCSSVARPGRAEDERSEHKKAGLDVTHQKLSDSIKSLQDARNSPDHGTSAVQETFNANKALVLKLQQRIAEDKKIHKAVKKRVQDLHAKVSAHSESLPWMESELAGVAKMFDRCDVARDDKKAVVRDSKEIEASVLGRLKTLSDGLKSNETESDTSMPGEQKDKLFAQQLSREAMIISEMAETLDKYSSGKYSDVPSSLTRFDARDLATDSDSESRKSALLQHAGIVAEKVRLQSRLVGELATLRGSAPDEWPEFKSASLPASVSQSKSGGFVGAHDNTPSLTLVQAQINYLLHIYNDRIARLTQDVKESQHRADSFQQKLVELVHACKTKDIEVVSQLALEVDTKASPASTVEDLPEWRQQVDYGMLHGAQANISTIDLKSEASYFAKLSDDISRMSGDVAGLASSGNRILEIDMTLSKLLKPSVIGEHASVIAYEAISQAQLLFLTRRITKDYEEQVLQMKNAVRNQAARCEALQRKLDEVQNGGDVKMQQLKAQHEQKVDNLMKQLTLVEQARQEMSTEMDQKLNKLEQKQKKELERSEAQHRKETDRLRSELKDAKKRLQDSERQREKHIADLKREFDESDKQHELRLASVKDEYESSLKMEKKRMRKQMDDLSADEAQRIQEIKSEFRKELESVIVAHEKEKAEIEDGKSTEIKILKETHRRELENAKYRHEKELEELKKDFEEALNEKQDEIDAARDEKTEKQNRNNEIDELQRFFERRFSNFEETHKKQLEELADSYREDVQRLQVKKERELEENVLSTKLAIDSAKKYYDNEVGKIQTDPESPLDSHLQGQYDKVLKEFEALSEMYSKKCAEIVAKDRDIESLQARLYIAEENSHVLEEQNERLNSKLEKELGDMKTNSLGGKNAEDTDDVQHLRVELGAKKLEVTILHQQMESLKQQVAMTLRSRLLHGPDGMSLEDFPSKKGVFRSSSERRAVSKVNFDD